MPARSLARVLGFRDLILIVIGTVIGSGIFLVPGNVIRASGGSVGAALLVWLVGGVLSLLGALGGVLTGVPVYWWRRRFSRAGTT